MIAETADVRDAVRRVALGDGQAAAPPRREKLPESQGLEYKDYFQFTEPVRQIPPHRILAINRGEKEGAQHVRWKGTLEAGVPPGTSGSDGPAIAAALPAGRSPARRLPPRPSTADALAAAAAAEPGARDSPRADRAGGGPRGRASSPATCAACCCSRRCAASACWPSTPASAPAARSPSSTRSATCSKTPSSSPPARTRAPRREDKRAEKHEAQAAWTRQPRRRKLVPNRRQLLRSWPATSGSHRRHRRRPATEPSPRA